jgi:hypothetical protein
MARAASPLVELLQATRIHGCLLERRPALNEGQPIGDAVEQQQQLLQL